RCTAALRSRRHRPEEDAPAGRRGCARGLGMHLLQGQPRGLTGEAEPVDLGQSPADIVILSAADTEIAGLAAARRALGPSFPSLRLANWMALSHPYSVDLYARSVL